MSRRSARIGPWPRRVAALICLLLAAVSATSTRPHATSAAIKNGLSTQLHHGEVAVPIAIASGNARALHPGDLIGIVATLSDPAGLANDAVSTTGTPATLIVDHLRVLSVADTAAGLGSDTTALVEVATSRTIAISIARYSSRSLMAILDDPP